MSTCFTGEQVFIVHLFINFFLANLAPNVFHLAVLAAE
jgi:hypothetical protein